MLLQSPSLALHGNVGSWWLKDCLAILEVGWKVTGWLHC